MNRKAAGRLLAQKTSGKKTKSEAGAVMGQARSKAKIKAAMQNLKKA